MTGRIDAGEFTWEKDFKSLHPSPFGMQVYERSIVRLFDAAWRGPVAGPPEKYPLPAPLDPKSYFRGRLVDIAKASRGEGWRIDPDWTPHDTAATRKRFVHVPMLIGETPGAQCRFNFEGSAAGIFVAAGPDAGIVEYSFDSGPWRKQNLFTEWSDKLHIPWAYVLDADLPSGRHELAMRPSANKDPRSQGTAVRIVNLLAN